MIMKIIINNNNGNNWQKLKTSGNFLWKMHVYYRWRIIKQSPGWYHVKSNKNTLRYFMTIEEIRAIKYCLKFFIFLAMKNAAKSICVLTTRILAVKVSVVHFYFLLYK